MNDYLAEALAIPINASILVTSIEFGNSFLILLKKAKDFLDLLSDVLGDQSSHRTGSELSSAMETISNNKSGIIILIRDLSSESLTKKFSRNTDNQTKNLKNIRDMGYSWWKIYGDETSKFLSA